MLFTGQTTWHVPLNEIKQSSKNFRVDVLCIVLCIDGISNALVVEWQTRTP